MKKTLLFLLAGIAFLHGVGAAENPPSLSLEDKVTEFTLANGLTFLVVERREAPVFFGLVRFKVGGVDEVPGITGLAHMFEHMVFKGTPAIGSKDFEKEKVLLDAIEEVGETLSRARAEGNTEKEQTALATLRDLEREHQKFVETNEMPRLYEENGGSGLNATTSADFTTYFVSLPSSRLELWMLMESERFKHPVMREFYKERDVVMEERRMRYESQPGGAMWELMLGTAFAAHPYRNPVIGHMSDLRTLTVADARTFFAEHYVPQNAVVVLAGDVDPENAFTLAQKYFGDIPKAPDAPLVRTREPEQKGERRATLEWDAEPSVMVAYHVPTWPHPDYFPLRVLAQTLAWGKSSRLERALVKTGLTSDAGVFFGPGERYNHLLIFGADPIAPRTTADVEAAFSKEIERLAREPVTARELERIRNNLEANFVRSLGSNRSLAFQMSQAHLLTGSWRTLLTYRDHIAKVAPEDVTRVAQTYLRPANRTVVTRVKVKKEAPGADAPAAPAPKKGSKKS